jgi:hypothetical protein
VRSLSELTFSAVGYSDENGSVMKPIDNTVRNMENGNRLDLERMFNVNAKVLFQ